jgi:hypothetical protein
VPGTRPLPSHSSTGLVLYSAACPSGCDALHLPSPWLNRSEAEGDLKELNGWIPAKLTRDGTSARSTHAHRTYARIMTDM